MCVTLLKKIERKIKKKTRKLFKLRVLYLPLQVCVRAHSARVRMETRHLRVTRRIFFFFLFFNTTQYYTGVLAAHTHTHTYIDFHGVSLPGRIGKFFRWPPPPPATRSTTATTIRGRLPSADNARGSLRAAHTRPKCFAHKHRYEKKIRRSQTVEGERSHLNRTKMKKKNRPAGVFSSGPGRRAHSSDRGRHQTLRARVYVNYNRSGVSVHRAVNSV